MFTLTDEEHRENLQRTECLRTVILLTCSQILTVQLVFLVWWWFCIIIETFLGGKFVLIPNVNHAYTCRNSSRQKFSTIGPPPLRQESNLRLYDAGAFPTELLHWGSSVTKIYIRALHRHRKDVACMFAFCMRAYTWWIFL